MKLPQKNLILGLLIALSSVLSANAGELTATGFVRVEKVAGVWWFVGPDGDKFISMGVNHIEPHLWLAPYNQQATLKKYGPDFVGADGRFNTHSEAAKKWMKHQLEVCRDLHFNTLGSHTNPAIDPRLYADQIYFIASLQTGPLAGWRERNGEGPRPDVFSVDFHNFLELRIKTVCGEYKDKRNLLGYLYTDVPSWKEQNKEHPAMVYPWLNALLVLGEASPGKWKWVEHLKARYASAEEVAKVWGLPVSSAYGLNWYKLSRLVTWFNPADEKRAQADMESFMPQIATQWYRLHYELIRQYDPNHLIFGDKNWIAWNYDWVVDGYAKYVDVVAVQAYGHWADDKKVTDRIYAVTGKPVFNGDGCIGWANEHQEKFGVKGFHTGAKSQADVTALYRETAEQMMATPYVIGWHHCGYLQQWDEAERGDSPKNENGFLDPFENYVTDWTEVIREVNSRLITLHGQAK